MERTPMKRHLSAFALALLLVLPAGTASAQGEILNELFGERVSVKGYLDFTNLVRADDFSGHWDWASNKLTLNLEVDIDLLGPEKHFLDEAKVFFILRPRYDFIYLTNQNDYGNEAGGGVNNLAPTGFSAFGAQFDDGAIVRNRFADTIFPLEVPYRPIDRTSDAREDCINCNLSQTKLAWGDTDTFREYPLREAYLDIKKGDLAIRLGKQQVVWGKTDFFRLQDVINPVDFGIHSFLDGLEDIRIPQWMFTGIYNFHNVGPLQDVSLEVVWNWDRFLPLGLGQAGEPWANIFGEEIKAFHRFHDVFGLGVRKQDVPGWHVNNTQFGARLEFILGPVRMSFSDYYRFKDLPIFNLVNRFSATNPNPVLDGGPLDALDSCCGEIIIRYPRVNIMGFSADYFEEFTETVWRFESTFTPDEDFVNTRASDWVSESDVFRWSLGIDRITFFRFLNPTRSFFLSYQIFGTHILDHEGDDTTGYLNYPDDFITTFFFTTNYMQDRLVPLAFVAYQFRADGLVIGAQVEYLFTNNWSARIGANAIAGRRHTFDNRPFEAFAGGVIDTENFFGTVREGFGADRDRDEIFFAFRYRF